MEGGGRRTRDPGRPPAVQEPVCEAAGSARGPPASAWIRPLGGPEAHAAPRPASGRAHRMSAWGLGRRESGGGRRGGRCCRAAGAPRGPALHAGRSRLPGRGSAPRVTFPRARGRRPVLKRYHRAGHGARSLWGSKC